VRDAVPAAEVTDVSDEPPAVRWGLGDAAAGWLVGLIGSLVAIGIVAAVTDTDAADLDTLSLSWIAVAQLGLWFGLLGAPLLAAWRKGNGPVRDYGLQATGGDVLTGVGWGVFAQFVLLPLIYVPIFLLSDVSREELTEPARNLTDRATDPLGVVLLVLIVGIGAPIVEEIFYRGLLQRSLVRRYGTAPAVAITAVLFAAAHVQPLQFPALLVFGLVAGVLAVRSGRLGPAIAAHMVFNLSAVAGLVLG
jgi:hypothetical protein